MVTASYCRLGSNLVRRCGVELSPFGNVAATLGLVAVLLVVGFLSTRESVAQRRVGGAIAWLLVMLALAT